MRLKSTIYLLFIILLNACVSSRNVSTLNMSSVYKPTDNVFHPDFSVWNQLDSALVVSVKINLDEFLYARQSDETFKSKIKLLAQVVQSYDDTKILDSAGVNLEYDMQEKNSARIVEVKFAMKHFGPLMMKLTVLDLNKSYSEDFYERFEVNSDISANDFLIKNKKGIPFYKSYFSLTDTMFVKYRDPAVKKFFVKYYHRNFELPATPFSFNVHEEFDYRPDSIFQISLDDSSGLSFAEQGLYHLQLDTAGRHGMTIYRFDQGYPLVANPRQLLEPLRYLVSKKEYEEMLQSPNIKIAVDQFWLARGGNEERTRALIKRYYGRVQEANRYFTSYTEGWKSDRGMIYLIFGAPNTVYLSENSESWTYGTSNSPLALSFFFTKVENPFTYNDFTLSRSPMYESTWYRAVETWRQGRVYNTFN